MDKAPRILNDIDLDMITRIVTHRLITSREKIEALDIVFSGKLNTVYGVEITDAHEDVTDYDSYAFHYLREPLDYIVKEVPCDHARAITHNKETEDMPNIKPFKGCDQCLVPITEEMCDEYWNRGQDRIDE